MRADASGRKTASATIVRTTTNDVSVSPASAAFVSTYDVPPIGVRRDRRGHRPSRRPHGVDPYPTRRAYATSPRSIGSSGRERVQQTAADERRERRGRRAERRAHELQVGRLEDGSRWKRARRVDAAHRSLPGRAVHARGHRPVAERRLELTDGVGHRPEARRIERVGVAGRRAAAGRR